MRHLRYLWLIICLHCLGIGCAPGPCGGPWYMDSDGDGVTDRNDDDADGDGYTAIQGDCADCDAARGPNFLDDSCDGVDQDCDSIDGPDGDAGCIDPMRAPGAPGELLPPPGLSTDALGARLLWGQHAPTSYHLAPWFGRVGYRS